MNSSMGYRCQEISLMCNNAERQSHGLSLIFGSPRSVQLKKRRRVVSFAVAVICAIIAALWCFMRLLGADREVNVVAYSPDGTCLAAGTKAVWNRAENPELPPNMVVLIDRKAGRVTRTLPLQNRLLGATCLSFSRDGRILAVGTWPFTVLWNLRTGRSHPFDASVFGFGTFAALLPDGKTLLQRSGAGIALVDMETGKTVRTIGDGEARALSRDGGALAIASKGRIDVLRLPSGITIRLLVEPKKDSVIERLAVAADGSSVATTGWFDHGLRRWFHIWDVRTGAMKDFAASSVEVVAFSFDGKRLATNGPGGSICLWDTSTAHLSRTMERDGSYFPSMATQRISSMEFSPDGRLLAVGRGANVEEWDISTGRRLKQYSVL
jgi:WD40 repeat protein